MILLVCFLDFTVSATHADFHMTLSSPLGVIINEYVVLHCQFEVWDLLTHPPRESTHKKRHQIIHLIQSLTVCVNVGVYCNVQAESEGEKVTYRMVSMIS